MGSEGRAVDMCTLHWKTVGEAVTRMEKGVMASVRSGYRPFRIRVLVGRVKVIVRVRRPAMVGCRMVRWYVGMGRMIKAAWNVGMARWHSTLALQVYMEGKGSGRLSGECRFVGRR